MLNAVTRTYIITQILSGRWIVLYPQRIIPTTAAVTPSTTIRVRANTSAGITSPLTSDRPGPWSLQWEEA